MGNYVKVTIADVDVPIILGTGTASIGVLGSNSGVDIGDVTVNNATGTNAVNVQDGGNSLTIDGTVVIGTGGNVIGVLGTGTNQIGHVVLDTGGSVIGVLGTGANVVGALATGGNVIGVLGTGGNTVGVLGTGTNAIGHVVLDTGSQVIGKVAHAVTSLTDGIFTVTTAYVREQLSTVSVACEYIIISPLTTNTGVVVVGGTTVVATATQRQGIPLVSGDPPLTLAINDLNKIWCDVTIAANGFSYIKLG